MILPLLLTLAALAAPANLLPNGGGETDPVAGGWLATVGATWAEDEAHSGAHSFKVSAETGGSTRGWTSPPIPRQPGQQFALTVWAKMREVSGRNGAFIGLYHLDANHDRIGQSGMLTLGGAETTIATTGWERYLTVGNLPAEVAAVQVNIRLYGAAGTVWFDDLSLTSFDQPELTAVRPLRRGIRLDAEHLAIVGDGAEAVRQALANRRLDVPVLDDAAVDWTGTRDLIVLGNLKTSRAVEHLYLQGYTFEDLYYPGPGGFVLRPLIDPLGTGANLLVVAGSDAAGQQRAVGELLTRLPAEGELADLPLMVETGAGYLGPDSFPWPASGGRREMASAARYLKSGDPAFAQAYRDLMIKTMLVPDDQLFDAEGTNHLFWVTQIQSWDLMESGGLFSDAERLAITNQLLKIMRSDQGYGYAGFRPGRFSRENHSSRAAQAFYLGWRYFAKYYGEPLQVETMLWRRKMQEFWTSAFESSRSFEDSLSQHALGGTLDNVLDLAFKEPDWSADFFASGRARRMGERCLAICNNLGDTVLLGDTAAGDYPTSVFSKLAWKLNDGRYQFMIEKRRGKGTSSDEPLRGFNVGLEPIVPADHVGLTIIDADEIFFSTLANHAGVELAENFDKLTFREGFDRDDEYLLLDGTAGGSHSYEDANSLGEFGAHDRRWLCEIDIFNGPTMSHHNAVTVARGGLGMMQVPQAAARVAAVEQPGFAYSATQLPQYNGVDWTRHLIWLPGRYTVAIDELTATEPGEYTFGLGWRSLGEPTLEPGRFTAAQDEVSRAALSFDGRRLFDQLGATSGQPARVLEGFGSLFYRAEAPGDFVETQVVVPTAGTYHLLLTTLDYPGRAILQTAIDGESVGQPVDLFGGARPQPTTHDLGPRAFTAGPHTVRFTVTGKAGGSTGYTVAVDRLELATPAELVAGPSGANRFALVFPPEVPTTLDRDSQNLGPYLPPSPHHEPILNIVEQSLSKRLDAGETTAFQNLFYARAGAEQRPVELRRVNDQVVLVRTPEEVALIGASATGAAVELGELKAEGKLFVLKPSGVVLHEATATLAGQPVAAERLAVSLTAAWDASEAGAGGAANPWDAWPALDARWSAPLTAEPLSVAVRTVDGPRVAVGLENGEVIEFGADGAELGRYAIGGSVHALASADLDGDGRDELLVGSDDEHLAALDADRQPLWDIVVPFLADEQPWLWWTLGAAKVRAIHAADLDGDGTPEILVGAGNMRLHCYDAKGRERWRYRTDHGTPTTITTAEIGGTTRVLTGNGLSSSSGNCRILDADGKLLATLFNGSWCTTLPAIQVGDLDGDGVLTVFCGNNRGDVRAYPAQNRAVELWRHNLTRPIQSLTVLGETVAVGSDSGYFCAFDQAGEKVWGRPLSSAIVATERLAGANPLLAAACKDGRLFLLTVTGEPVGQRRLADRLLAATAADLDEDGQDELIALSRGPAGVVVVGR